MQVKSIAECSKGHSAIPLTFIKLPFVFKTFVLSIFEWPLATGFTVYDKIAQLTSCDMKYGDSSNFSLTSSNLRTREFLIFLLPSTNLPRTPFNYKKESFKV